MSQLKTSNKCR